MPVTFAITSGGIKGSTNAVETFVQVQIQLPDSFPGNLTISGFVQGVLNGVTQAVMQITNGSGGQTIALPAVPGSGNTFWNVQIDVTTGTATIQTSSVADPALLNSNNVIVARQTLPTGATQPWSSANPFNVVDFT